MSLEGKSQEDIKKLEDQLISILEKKKGVSGNISLIRELGWDDNIYWSIRDRLVNEGRLQLGKGKGGSVRMVESELPAEGPEEALVVSPGEGESVQQGALTFIPEEKLYEPMAKVLKERWTRDNRFRESIVEITAKQGKRETGGKWSRPDITVVGMATYLYVPGRHFDVATFEIKVANCVDVTAVYEALAHRRAATRSYVIIHIPEGQDQSNDSMIEALCDEAKRYGIGVIVAEKPSDYEAWEERVEAVRVDPAPERVNDFLAIQLSEGAKQQILQWFK